MMTYNRIYIYTHIHIYIYIYKYIDIYIYIHIYNRINWDRMGYRTNTQDGCKWPFVTLHLSDLPWGRDARCGKPAVSLGN